MGKHEKDKPDISGCVDDGRCSHDWVACVTSADGQSSVTSERIADDGGERCDNRTIEADEADRAEDEDTLKRELQDAEVEHQNAEFGDNEGQLVDDDVGIRELDGNVLVADWDIFVVTTEAISSFVAGECNDGKG